MSNTTPVLADEVEEQFLENVVEVSSTSNVPPEKWKTIKSITRKLLMTATPITNPNQLVTPTIAWDWPVTVSGATAFEQFQFADAIPQSIETATEYVASSDSFSTNYRAFLDFIDADKFPAKSMLEDAKKMIAYPSSPLDTRKVPRGWTKVTRSGIKRWAPIWEVSDSAKSWKRKVLAGDIVNKGSFALNLKTHKGKILKTADNGDGLVSLDAEQPAFDFVTISAKAWGQISISPGTWYNSSIIALGKSYVPDPDIFFGPSGLLRGRVSAFLVAYKAEFEFSAEEPIDADMTLGLAKQTDLHAMGIPVEIKESSPSDDSNKLQLNSTSEVPTIVAAIIEN